MMPENKIKLIAAVPPEGGLHSYHKPIPDDGSLWGEVSGNLFAAVKRVEASDLPFDKIIYTRRSPEQASGEPIIDASRKLIVAQASEFFDLIELDFTLDTSAEVLNQIAPESRIISVTLAPAPLEALLAIFYQMASIEAFCYKIIIAAEKSGDDLLPLALLKKLGRKDVIAYADGPLGAWTRLVAPALGSPAIYGTLAADPSADGAFPIKTLMDDYGLPRAPVFKCLYGIAGRPVFRSLSPRLHNAAYRDLAVSGFFVPFHIDNYEAFHRQVVQSPIFESLGFELRGLTVVSPFKEIGYQMADKVVNTVSVLTQSCNLMAKREEGWIADSTDPLAVFEALRRLEVKPRGLVAAVIGCGGAGRAIAATLLDAGAKVTLFNRTPARGERASQQLNVPFELLQNLAPEAFDILVNATPLGKQAHEQPFDPERLNSSAVFIDYAYGAYTTTAIEALREKGVGCVDGREVLIIQVRRQFEVMTGEIMPEKLAVEKAFESKEDHFLTLNLNIVAP